MLVRRLALALVFVSAAASAQQAAPPIDAVQKTDTAPALQPPAGAVPIQSVAAVAHAPIPSDPCEAGKNDVCTVSRSQPTAKQKSNEASLGDSIVVTMKDSVYTNIVPPAQAGTKKITLYLNGNDTRITPDKYDDGKNQLTFHLARTADNKNVWEGLLRDPYKTPQSVLVTIGVADSPPLTSGAEFTLIVVKWAWYAWMWIVLLIIVLVAFFWLAKKRDILRDGSPVNGNPQPYSLGKTQMAWWFFLIIIGFVMIWLVSGDQDTISASLLTLMGISGGTALGSSLIERNARNPATPAPSGGAPAAPPPPPPPPAVSRGWLRDILSDSNGSIVLHRLQNVLWTLVLGIMLVVSVMTSLTMPEFNTTLVTLMGISSGTYVGFKFAED
jgi:hypothetical protein